MRTVYHPLRPGSLRDEPKETRKFRANSTWKPGCMSRLPLLGIGSLLVALLATLGCVVILVLSNGQPVDSWPSASQPIHPSVVLAVLSALTNLCLRTALAEGLNNTWWREAARGTTLGKLQRLWDYGTGIRAPLIAGRRTRWLSLASITVSLVVIDGPLLQRASSTRLATEYTNSTQVQATVARHLAYGQTGFRKWNGSGALKLGNRSLLSPSLARVLDDYNARRAISAASFSGCEGTCSGVVEAAGLYRTCEEWHDTKVWVSYRRNLTAHPGVAFTVNLEWNSPAALLNVNKFPKLLPILPGIPTDEPFIWLNISYATATFKGPKAEDHSMSNMTYKSCKLYSATRKYHVTINNRTDSTTSNSVSATISLTHKSEYVPGSVQNQRKDIVEKLTQMGFTNITTTNPWQFANRIGLFRDLLGGNAYSYPVYETLSGISTAVEDLAGSNVTFKGFVPDFIGVQGWISMTGSLAMQLLDSEAVGSDFYFGMQWQDPTPVVFSMLDELMFRSAIDAAHNNTLARIEAFSWTGSAKPLQSFPQPQLLSMTQQQSVLVYESRYMFLAISVSLMCLTALIVSPTFHGFWTLDTQMSLNPIVTALAFRAPALDDVPPQISNRQLREIGDTRKVQYREAEEGVVVQGRRFFSTSIA